MVDDEAVDLPELRHRRVGDALHVSLAAGVGLHRHTAAVLCLDESDCLREVILGAHRVGHTVDLLGHVADDDVRTFAGEDDRV